MLFRLGCITAMIAVIACSKQETTIPGGGSSGGPGDPVDSGNPNGSSNGSTGTSGNPPRPEYITLTAEKSSFGDGSRSYFLGMPKNLDAQKTYPVVLSFHGNPGSAEGQAQYAPFDAVSKEEAILVYPQAATEDWDLYTPTDSNRDMAFIKALVEELKKKPNVDKNRVFGFGYSGGGFFLTQFTCRFGGVFKAISVHAGGGPDEEQMGYQKRPNGCYVCPGGPIAILVTHGTADAEVEVGSGEFTHHCYAATNGCKATLSGASPAPCQVHDGCPAAKPVKWCPIEGHGHGLWGDAVKESWSFFNALP